MNANPRPSPPPPAPRPPAGPHTPRQALADLDRLTTALRDRTARLAHRLAAVEATVYPHRRRKD